MGTSKSFVKLGSQPLIEIVIQKVTDFFHKQPVLITNQFADYRYLGCDMVGDIIQGKGPLGGIQAGLIKSVTPYIFVFACDMPFIDKTLVHYMLNRLGREDILIPRYGTRMEPLHAIYSKRCLPAITAHLDNDRRSVQSFFDEVNVVYIDQAEMNRLQVPEYCFLNINTREELDNAKAYLDNLRS
ncbi:molybdenum cofactor guanylyltransferase [Sporomusa termitida]|nr:molybdenum cofactor guanylyltransferase [Sporomusa termitida]